MIEIVYIKIGFSFASNGFDFILCMRLFKCTREVGNNRNR